VGDLLVADHPEIARYLSRHFGRRRVVTIAYGAHAVTQAPTDPVTELGLTPGGYGMVVCRPIPENSVTEIVAAWSRRTRGMPLLVVGPFEASEGGRLPSNPPRRADNTRARVREPYPNEVRAAASAEVQFPGAIFDPARLSALRHHAGVYLHGHTVGGTNPSLVEAMAAGNAVVAHDNVYNRWVAGEGNAYFTGTDDLAGLLDRLLPDTERRRAMGAASRARHQAEFTWSHIGDQYEVALRAAMDRRRRRQPEKKGVSV
jgi:glycosyltransferase involved in cell wall biosynthesis